VARFLSNEWLDALASAAAGSVALREASSRQLVIEQTVRNSPAGDVTYCVVVADGAVAVRTDDAPKADVTFVTDYATAVAINRGELSAQAAFLRGQLRVGGDVAELSRNADVLALLDDVFAGVRAGTEY
jgi:putative sterol carrier protein